MLADAQFVVSTLTQGKMGAAQALYDLTIQELGVSKLVSVKFEPLAAPAPPARDAVALGAV